ncbi:MAG: hypothetical protein E7666_05660 [Ruminococcaceae bacterium]|nr:hypothetical protein [Oscillospiraceae bacterium]
MKIVNYESSMGAYTLPEGFSELLQGRSIEEQMNFYRMTSHYANAKSCDWRDRRAAKWFTPLDRDSDVDALIVDNGLVVGVMVNAYFQSKKPLLAGQDRGMLTHVNSDNNGAGYKETEFYCYLALVSEHYYDEA